MFNCCPTVASLLTNCCTMFTPEAVHERKYCENVYMYTAKICILGQHIGRVGIQYYLKMSHDWTEGQIISLSEYMEKVDIKWLIKNKTMLSAS